MNPKPVVPFETIRLLRQLAEKFYKQGDTSDAFTLAFAIAEVVQATGTLTFYADTFFGGCPCCGDCEEVLIIGIRSYGVCHEHRKYWYIGTDHLTLCNDTDESVRHKQSLLAPYREVPTMEAFTLYACPCCGFSVEHALWCIIPGPTRP